jgi:predicted TIM-barrel fold metal-dependent hydrolase
MINRRRFLNYLGVSTLGISVAACDDTPPKQRYNLDDIALLASQREAEALAAGKGPFGEQQYLGYRGLAKLPWFDLDTQGKLLCIDDTVPMSIDMHAHLGMSVLFKPELDLQAKTARVKHLLDCDSESALCELDLDVYINGNFTESNLDTLESTIVAQGLWGSDITRTHTIANLVAEMDSMRVERAVILPIKLDLPFGDDQTEVWRSEIEKSGQDDRLLAGFSVHPLDSNCIEQMREHAKSGLRLMKLHPPVQKFYPDDPAVMKVYEEARSLGIAIFFHGGRAGIEPESSQRYAMPRHYHKALLNFPEVNFILGHGGARDVDAMLDLRLRHKNAWLGTHGQGVTKLDKIVEQTKGLRILFGTDWPFYHLGSSLAKALIVTESPFRKDQRLALLRGNAIELLQNLN